MTVACPSCGICYRVDPERVPAHGVVVRCPRCRSDFPVFRAPATAAPSAPSAQPASPAPDPRAPKPSRRYAATPDPASEANARARRIARTLVSDIATYHSERRTQSLVGGTLKADFEAEVRKSWNEYVAQVGRHLVRGTPHFRDALNEILAGGRRVF